MWLNLRSNCFKEVKQPARVAKTLVTEVCVGNSFEVLAIEDEDILVGEIVCDREGGGCKQRGTLQMVMDSILC